MLAGFAAAAVVVLWNGWRLRERPRSQRHFETGLAALALAAWAGINAMALWPSGFDPAKSLPLHVCDLTGLFAPLALSTQRRPWRALLYYWGLGLSTQAMITPDLESGPDTLKLYLFWLAHYLIVGGAVYEIVVRRYRPSWPDCALAIAAGLGYLAVVLPLDIAFGFNYGYVGPTVPNRPTLIDALGPWPARVPIVAALAATWMVILTLPWELAKGRQGCRHPARS